MVPDAMNVLVEPDAEPAKKFFSSLIGFVFFIGIFVVMIAFTFWFGLGNLIQLVLLWIVPDQPDWRYGFCMGAVVALLMVVPLPVVTPIVILVPGMVFGFWIGFLILFVGLFVGVPLAFVIGRWALQDTIRSCIVEQSDSSAKAILKTLEADDDSFILLILYRWVSGPFLFKNYPPVVLKIPLWKLVLSAIPHHFWAAALFSSFGAIFKDSATLVRSGGKWEWGALHWQQLAMFSGMLVCFALITGLSYRMYTRKAREYSDSTKEALPLHGNESTRA